VGVTAKTVLLAGATGLVGNSIMQHCLDDESVGLIILPTRRPVPIAHPKIRNVVMDLLGSENFDPLPALSEAIKKVCSGKIDSYISALGTTIKTAGSREAFIAVDRDLVCRFAEIAKGLGAKHAVFISSVGANRQTSNFYLRVKGETEDLLERMQFDRVDHLRPGLLLGPRLETRRGEAFAQKLAFIYNPLLMGPLGRYRAIQADAVAAAAVHLLTKNEAGIFVHENSALLALQTNK
jgi:nucleoside-diphosphate-sugar epimerase